jgi:hypothetical protein
MALALMYGMEVPAGTPVRFFGPLSDWGSGLGTLLVCATILVLPWPAKSRWAMWVAKIAVTVLSVCGALGSFLLVLHVIDFAPGTAAAMTALFAQAIWLAVIPLRIARTGTVPLRLGRAAQWLGLAFLAGAAMVGIGFALPWPAAQWGAFILGGIVGLVGWVGAPVWYVVLGIQARQRWSMTDRSLPPRDRATG